MNRRSSEAESRSSDPYKPWTRALFGTDERPRGAGREISSSSLSANALRMLTARFFRPVTHCARSKTARTTARIGKQLPRAAQHLEPFLKALSSARTAVTQAVAPDSRFLSEAELSPVHLRELQHSQAAFHLFHVKGVSFEDRQALLAGVKEGTAIVLAHEPENEYDSHAIAVRLLDGKRLGYVPRDITQSPFFAQPVSFGHVRSLGVGASSGLFGVQVEHQPSLLPLMAEAIPANLQAQCIDVARSAAGKATSSGRSCEITGSAAERPELRPLWHANTKSREISLAGMQFLAPQLCRAQDLLLRDGPPDREAALVFQAINGWTSDELRSYREHQQRLSRERNDGSWSLAVG